MLKKWEELPEDMRTDEVKMYYDILARKQLSLILKRLFDFVVALVLLIIISPILVVIAVIIKLDSSGDIFYRQVRITQYGKEFRIHKFRTMVSNADKIGSLVTVGKDSRVTKVGRFLRKYRLDELPQLIDIIEGNMSFVGTRPEVPKYVIEYTNEMKATLLLPAGVTSKASIYYKDEADLLDKASDVDYVYLNEVLPQKMKYNLECIKKFSFCGDIVTMVKTVLAMVEI